MIWQLKDRGFGRPRDLPQHIERRLMTAVSRFSGRIQKIIVFLDDRIGLRGGMDKTCRILVKTHGYGVVAASATHADWMTAADQATAVVGRTLARHVTRHRLRRGVSRRVAVPRMSPTLGPA